MAEKMIYGVKLSGIRPVFDEKLVELGAKYENMVIVDAETGLPTNVLGFKAAYPDRFVSVGIAEQTAVSFAFALSRSGKIPVVPLFASFLTRRACDQLFIQAGYAHANIKFFGCYCGLSTPNTGATHQSINDIAIMRSIPGMIVAEAADPQELTKMMDQAMAYDGPVYIRMIRGDLPEYEKIYTNAETKFSFGKSEILLEGSDVTIAACGLMIPRALEAAAMLKAEGISAEVINCSSIKPLDSDTLVASVQKTGRIVTAENGSTVAGMGSAIAECLAERYPVPMRFVGMRDVFGASGTMPELMEAYNLTPGEIIRCAKDLLK